MYTNIEIIKDNLGAGFFSDYARDLYFVCIVCKKSLLISIDGFSKCSEQEKTDFINKHELCK